MTHAVGRAVAAAVLAALLGAASVALFYAWHPALTVEFDRDLGVKTAIHHADGEIAFLFGTDTNAAVTGDTEVIIA